VCLLTAGNANAHSFSLGSVSLFTNDMLISVDQEEDVSWFIPGELSSAVDASALSGDVSDRDASVAPGWGDLSASATATTFTNHGGRAEASGLVSWTGITINAFARNSANRAGRAASDANATGDWNFEATETGMLSVSVPVAFGTQLSVDGPEGENAFMHVFARLFLMESPNVYSVEVFGLDRRLEGVGSSSDQIVEWMTVSRFFEAGQRGTFRFDVGADGSATSVPEPSTLLLIGSAFALLQGVRRRRRSALDAD
jgi:hypothetical protein